MHFRHPRPLLKAHLSIQSLIAISEYEYECDVVLFVVCVYRVCTVHSTDSNRILTTKGIQKEIIMHA